MPQTRYFSEAEVAAFRRDGYLAVSQLLSTEEARRLSEWTAELQALPEVPGRHMVYYEDSLERPGERVLSRIENFCPHHAGLDGLVRGRALLRRVGELFGEAAVLFKDKINFKLPGGGGFEPHQDVQAGWGRYAELFITAMISIDEATAANGCLEIAPRSQLAGRVGADWRPLDEEELGQVDFVPCPTRPGDALFFDSLTPHRSAPNRSQRPRRVLYVTYNRLAEGDHRARYYADKRRSFPPDCERQAGREYVFRV